MTCIVGYRTDEGVMLGGDSAGVDSYLGITERADRKVFRKGQYVFGGCGSFRMLDILQYQLDPPEYHDHKGDVREFLVKEFIPELRRAVRANAWLHRENGIDSFNGDGAFLLGLQDRLFTIWSDLQVGEPSRGWAAMGCGEDMACGALYILEGTGLSVRQKLRKALEAAAYLSGGVIPPFHFVKNY